MNTLESAIQSLEASDLPEKGLLLEYLRRYAPRVPDYLFCPTTTGFLIGTLDESRPFKALKGFAHIYKLLETPGNEVQSLALYAPKIDPELALDGGEGNDGPEKFSMDRHYAHHDTRYQQSLRAEYLELQEELEEESDPDARELLLERCVEIAKAIAERRRGFADPAERARKAVWKAIRAALTALQEYSPEIAEHLEASIETGEFCCYRPREKISWDLKKVAI